MVIETDRLLLAPLRLSDLEDFVALHREPEVARFIPEYERDRAAERLRANEIAWEQRGHGLMSIRDRDTGRFLGRSGLWYWPQFDETEVGWALRPEEWGHGYATEAAGACASWGFRHLRPHYLTAMIRPDNDRSLRVAARLGFEAMRQDTLNGFEVVVHALSPSSVSVPA